MLVDLLAAPLISYFTRHSIGIQAQWTWFVRVMLLSLSSYTIMENLQYKVHLAARKTRKRMHICWVRCLIALRRREPSLGVV